MLCRYAVLKKKEKEKDKQENNMSEKEIDQETIQNQI